MRARVLFVLESWTFFTFHRELFNKNFSFHFLTFYSRRIALGDAVGTGKYAAAKIHRNKNASKNLLRHLRSIREYFKFRRLF